MAVEKLSQFPLASLPPALTDTIAGANPGATNIKYTASQLGGFVPATGNLTFYVATTGSDSNPGTIGSPFATIQHAVLVAQNFNYQALYSATINVAAGTYVQSNINLGGLLNAVGFGTIIGSTPTFPILDTLGSGGNGYGFVANGGGGFTNWNVQNFEIHSNGSANSGATAFLAQRGSQVNVTNLIYADPTNAGTGEIFQVESWAKGILINLTITGTKIGVIAEISGNTAMAIGGTVTFPAALATNFLLISDGTSSITWNPSSVVNGGGVTCSVNQIALSQASQLLTANGLISDVPGTNGANIDQTSAIINLNASPNYKSNWGLQSNAGIPTASQIPPGTWGVWKDSSGGGLYVIANDAGTIKKVALV